jgi:KDO2-lipid IV(A) lauroyltransferase
MARSKILDFIEYIPLRIGVGLVDALPISAALSCGRGLGRLSWTLLPKRRRIAIGNVLRSGITADPIEAERIAKASFLSFGMLAVESLAASRLIRPETLVEHVEFCIPAATRAFIDAPGKGGIYAIPHLGNWEVSAHVMSFSKKVVAVARNLNNHYAQAFMLRRNPRRNMDVVSKHSTDRLSLIRPLKTGAMLGLVCDQHASSHGVMAEFFGRPAKTVTSPARLHLATRAPIICGCCVRTGLMKFKILSSEPLMYEPTSDRDADVLRITNDINRRLEAFIRLYPEQYLWAHRRWR